MRKVQTLGTLLLAAFVLAFITACATPAPSIQSGPDAELSFDGLSKVDNSQADVAWARPDFDISRYTKLMLISSGFEYRDVTNRGRTQMERSRGGPFYIDQDRRARFEQLVGEIFAEDLQQLENFEIVSEPGPDVMIVRGALLDIVTYVPPTEGVAGNIDIYLSNIGEATLVLELRDSQTGTILARSVDRRAAERMGGQMMRSNRVTNTAEVRRLIRFWSQRLREGLDGFVQQAASTN